MAGGAAAALPPAKRRPALLNAASSPEAKGWRLYLFEDVDDEAGLATYCPYCVIREFGELRTERTESD